MHDSYLNIIYIKSERSSYTKFRLSIHKLTIEKLRYIYKGNRMPLDQRICKYSTLNEIEDETHFLMVCPLYNDARLKRFTAMNTISPQFHHHVWMACFSTSGHPSSMELTHVLVKLQDLDLSLTMNIKVC